MVKTGLDLLAESAFARLAGLRIGVVCNQAAVTCNLDHLLDLLLTLHRSDFLKVDVVFGPQHGLGGHTQDNMVEWEGYRDPRSGWRVQSLYGEVRQPKPEMLRGVEVLVIDLPDIGSRYYTFIWTLALCMEVCEELAIPILLLDRPNPIGGLLVEGPVMKPDFASFVGLHPLPARHGMTLGEIAAYLRGAFYPQCVLETVEVENWDRSRYLDETGLPWVVPSPNMPGLGTALVYPGMCLLESTNISEGRGTTRPFEMVGAPFLNGHELAYALNKLSLPGVKFRPIEFQPTFQKHAGRLCEGCFVHVLDRNVFLPVLTAIALLQVAFRLSPETKWNPPPYEYELKRMPIQVLAGNDWLRVAIESQAPIETIKQSLDQEALLFEPLRSQALMYG